MQGPETGEDMRAVSQHEIMTVSAVKRKGTRILQGDGNGQGA